MKKWFIFGGGVITGIVLTFIVTIIYAANQPENELESDNGMTLFDTPGEIIDEESFDVFQVIEENAALVRGKGISGGELHIGIVYLLINDEGKYYYDDEIIYSSNQQIFVRNCFGWHIDILACRHFILFQWMALYGDSFCSNVFGWNCDDGEKSGIT